MKQRGYPKTVRECCIACGEHFLATVRYQGDVPCGNHHCTNATARSKDVVMKQADRVAVGHERTFHNRLCMARDMAMGMD